MLSDNYKTNIGSNRIYSGTILQWCLTAEPIQEVSDGRLDTYSHVSVVVLPLDFFVVCAVNSITVRCHQYDDVIEYMTVIPHAGPSKIRYGESIIHHPFQNTAGWDRGMSFSL